MRKRTGIILIAVLAFLLLGINAIILIVRLGGTSKAERQLAKGQAYLEDEEYEEAVNTFQEVLAEDDRNLAAYQGLVEAYKKSGELYKARDTMEKGYKKTQDESLAGELTAIMWEEAGKKDRVVKWSDYGVEQAVRKMTGIANGDIMLSDIWEISDFYLYKSNISDLGDLENLPNVTSLHLYECQISSLELLKHFDNLEKLYLSDNQITNLEPLAQMQNLEWLDLGNNQIEDISPLKRLRNLSHLDLCDNQITDIQVLADLTDLEYLNLNGNPVSDLSPIKKLKQLETLYLENVYIDDINVLSSLGSLKKLSLAGNYRIGDYAVLGSLASLEELSLANTNISDLNVLSGLKKLMYLDISRINAQDLSPVSKVQYLKNVY